MQSLPLTRLEILAFQGIQARARELNSEDRELLNLILSRLELPPDALAKTHKLDTAQWALVPVAPAEPPA